jgi:hypothetical protein
VQIQLFDQLGKVLSSRVMYVGARYKDVLKFGLTIRSEEHSGASDE